MEPKLINNWIGKVFLNRYKIKSFWRKGGQSLLFDAIDLKNEHKNIIIKAIEMKDENTQYKDEHLVFSTISNQNENLIKFYDYSLTGNYYLMIIEKIDGTNLRDFINHNQISLELAIDIILQIINGLKTLHFNKNGVIIHRDIKPENILIDKENKIKIIDLGISTLYTDDDVLTHERDIDLSINYACCDLLNLTREIRCKIKGKEKKENVEKFKQIVSFQLDIHSIGVLLYELLVHNLPFKTFKTRAEQKDKINIWRKYDIPKISYTNKSIPIQIDNIIHKCTASKEEYLHQRYKDINELEQDLLNYKNLSNEPLWNQKTYVTENNDYKTSQVTYNIKKRYIILSLCLIVMIIFFSLFIWHLIK